MTIQIAEFMKSVAERFKEPVVNFLPQQFDALNWVMNDRGSLELKARAGCGKTFTLMQIVRAIVHARLGEVALMAFNKKIADEISFKLKQLGIDWRVAQGGTVHSFGFGAWRKLAPGVKVDKEGVKVKNLIIQCSLEEGGAFYIENTGVICRLVSLAKQRAIGHLCSIDDDNQWYEIINHYGLDEDFADNVTDQQVVVAAKRVYRMSLNQCREIVDFDDMILAPLYFKARFWQKDWILVDEAQDTNPARRALALAMLKPGTGRMIFVGDPAQAIYGFTGADNDAMDQLKSITGAKTLPLNVTMRCPRKVVNRAQHLVPDFTAHEKAPEGELDNIEYDALEAQNLSAEDVILCRNTAPLISLAFNLIGKGIACRVEGREIGNGLIRLARRWKIKTLSSLLNKLDDYESRMKSKLMSKGQESRIQQVEDMVACLKVIIDRCQSLNKHGIDDLVREIEYMFGDTPKGEQPNVLTLSTVHKSKGREWTRVFLLGEEKFMPSRYAKKAWEQEQEKNLIYVAYTRAMKKLVNVSAPPEEAKKEK